MEILKNPSLQAAWHIFPEARLVGGAVRDALLGKAGKDIDLATPRHPEEVMQHLTHHGYKPLPTGLAHGTVMVMLEKQPVEITTLRRDIVTDGRHAQVAFDASWKEDAFRRDLTMNALFLDQQGKIHDFVGGQDDLKAGRVRFVGSAQDRIEEDRLRALRWVRFQARFGKEQPDQKTLQALSSVDLSPVSSERIWQETQQTLKIKQLDPILPVLKDSKLWEKAMGGTLDWKGLERLDQLGAPADPLLRLKALQAPQDLPQKWKMARSEALVFAAISEIPASLDNDDPGPLRRSLGANWKDVLAQVSWYEQARTNDPKWGKLRGSLSHVEAFPASSKDLQDRGMSNGPEMGKALNALQAYWIKEGFPDRKVIMQEASKRFGEPMRVSQTER